MQAKIAMPLNYQLMLSLTFPGTTVFCDSLPQSVASLVSQNHLAQPRSVVDCGELVGVQGLDCFGSRRFTSD